MGNYFCSAFLASGTLLNIEVFEGKVWHPLILKKDHSERSKGKKRGPTMDFWRWISSLLFQYPNKYRSCTVAFMLIPTHIDFHFPISLNILQTHVSICLSSATDMCPLLQGLGRTTITNTWFLTAAFSSCICKQGQHSIWRMQGPYTTSAGSQGILHHIITIISFNFRLQGF